jgi:hypothetical protein
MKREDRLELLRREEAERDQEMNKRMNALIRDRYNAMVMAEGHKADPEPEITREDVQRMRSKLIADDVDHGYGSIAKALNTSESTVRRRLGKIK